MDTKVLADLFVTFMKIGFFTVGGGYAMLPIISREVVDIKKWAAEEEMADFFTMAQACPGIVAINTATAVGTRVCKLPGALAATAGIVLPSFVVIVIIAMAFQNIREVELIASAFKGIRAVVVAMMFVAVLRLMKTNVKNIFQGAVCIISAFLIFVLGVLPQYLIFGAIFAGTVMAYVKTRRA